MSSSPEMQEGLSVLNVEVTLILNVSLAASVFQFREKYKLCGKFISRLGFIEIFSLEEAGGGITQS